MMTPGAPPRARRIKHRHGSSAEATIMRLFYPQQTPMKGLLQSDRGVMQSMCRGPKPPGSLTRREIPLNGGPTQHFPLEAQSPAEENSACQPPETPTFPMQSRIPPARERLVNSRNLMSQLGHYSNPDQRDPQPPNGPSRLPPIDHFPRQRPARITCFP